MVRRSTLCPIERFKEVERLVSPLAQGRVEFWWGDEPEAQKDVQELYNPKGQV